MQFTFYDRGGVVLKLELTLCRGTLNQDLVVDRMINLAAWLAGCVDVEEGEWYSSRKHSRGWKPVDETQPSRRNDLRYAVTAGAPGIHRLKVLGPDAEIILKVE